MGPRSNVEKTMKNSFFFPILSVIPKECWKDCNITVISGEFHTEKNYGQLFIPQKKTSPSTSQNSRFPILRPNLKPLSGMEIIFSQNLNYSYSFLGWYLPGITMSSDSLHNYFGITVKRRKNEEKIGFFDFCLWSRNNVGIIATSR